MYGFDLGQIVYWIELDRADGTACSVTVRSARFHTARHNGGTVCVVNDSGQCEFLSGKPTLFANNEEADTFALGAAMRRIINFGYRVVTIIDHRGKVWEVTAASVKMIEKGAQP